MTALPDALAGSPWAPRIAAAISAVRGAGKALLELRGTINGVEEAGGQLKTAIDLAAEGWVLGYLEGSFPHDTFLAEERHDRDASRWLGAPAYWTVDALDGTRSYVEGFDGFCVQVAFVENGVPVLGVIYEPVADVVFAGATGCGAWKLAGDTGIRLTGSRVTTMTTGLRFVDSTPPGPPLGAIVQSVQGVLVECGSVGLKICRLLEDRADVYAKRFRPKLWDVAPGEALLREVGIQIGTWDGAPFEYAGTRTHYESVLAATPPLFATLVDGLR
ncbi:3'(2'),5'-bisphosphate nucleotidase CysQ [soil metagenome]